VWGTKMQEPEDNSAISTMVEIDPDPPSEGHSPHRRDFALGLLLILAVLSWAGWQWWHQQEIESHYRVAQQAAARQDWDAAYEHYTAASEYKDAHSRASEVANLIRGRDSRYQAALAHFREEQWAASLQALKSVRDIQPGYRETESMSAEAEKNVYRSAFDGAIALRTERGQHGLYWRTGDSWVWLDGSDHWSNVLGSGPVPGASIIYDAPTEDWSPDAMPPREPLDVLSAMLPMVGSPALKGRRLMAAILVNGRVNTVRVALDPAEYNFYLTSESGVWGLRYNAMALVNRERIAQYYTSSTVGDLSAFDLAYQAYDGSTTSTLTLPGVNWSVMDISLTDDLALLIESNKSSGTNGTRSNLHLVDAQGKRRLLCSHEGDLRTAHFSPNGQHILLSASAQPPNPFGEKALALLLDATGNRPPQELPRESKGQMTTEAFSLVGATFLSAGTYEGKILALYSATRASIVSIYDPANPQTAITSFELAGRLPRGAWVVGVENSNDLLISWPSTLNKNRRWPAPKDWPAARNEHSLLVIKLSPGKPPLRAGIPISNRESVSDIKVRGDYFIYTTDKGVPRTREARSFTTYSVHFSALGDAEVGVNISALHNTDVAYQIAFPFQMPWNLGSQMAAYTTSGQLRARTYDGDIELPLEPGVTAIYSSQPYERADWIR